MPRRKGQTSPILRTTPSPTSSTEGNRRPSPSFAEFQELFVSSTSGTDAGGSGQELSDALLSSLGAKAGLEEPGPSARKRRRSQPLDDAPPRTRSRLDAPLPSPRGRRSRPDSPGGLGARHSEPHGLHLLAHTQAPTTAEPSGRAAVDYSRGFRDAVASLQRMDAASGGQAFPDMCCVAGSRSARCQLPHHHAPPPPRAEVLPSWAPLYGPGLYAQAGFLGQQQAAYSQHFFLSLMSSIPPASAQAAGLWENHEALIQVAQRMAHQYQAHPKGLTKAQIAELGTFKYEARETLGEDRRGSSPSETRCVVCLSGFQSRQLLRLLPCHHHFHLKCIDKWLRTNRTCPICRGDAGAELRKA